MTRERVRELLPIMQAYAEGKTIQFLDGGNWYDVYDTDFYKSPDRYRIKPEPKYRPFKTWRECWNEMHKHPDYGWVKRVKDPAYICLHKIEKIGRVDGLDFEYMFDRITFTDGTPFGIKEE